MPTIAKSQDLYVHFPWTSKPLIVCAPMRLISTAPLAHAVTKTSGLGFLGAGTDLSTLSSHLKELINLLIQQPVPKLPESYPYIPIGIGIITHLASLDALLSAFKPLPKPPAAIWLFAPEKPSDLTPWATAIRNITPTPQLWIQAGSVSEAVASVHATHPDVLVLQGVDAGGHGLQRCASIVPLIPETLDALTTLHARGEIPSIPPIIAAGGIIDGRGVASALALGAQGAVLGTRLLATPEAIASKGYKDEVIRAADGGLTTIRSRVYDFLRGTDHWPTRFGGRGVVNASWEEWERTGKEGLDANKTRYQEAEKSGDAGWGSEGRMTTYAGTGVGLVRRVQRAEEVVDEVREEARRVAVGLKAKL